MAIASAGLTLVLLVAKFVHRQALRVSGVRSAHYVASIGELVSRGILPTRLPSGWARDPLFHDALADYRLLLTGKERRFVDELATAAGIPPILVARTRRRFPKSARLRALGCLVDLATPAQINHLRALLADGDAHVRIHAIRGLARLNDTQSIPFMLELATRARPWEAARLADALVDMGSDGVPAIQEWINSQLQDQDPAEEVVALAARVLGLIGDPTAEATLLALLRSDRAAWKVAAASSLEQTGGTESIEALLDALDDREWRVRARAVVALGAMAEPRLGRPISALLYDPSWWVRQNAASALSSIPGGDDHLLAAVRGPDPYAADAALNQLTVAGVLAVAVDRVRSGSATARDHQLADVASSS
ncbi:MAG TPA: HEAT repeat domain-containing protein [Acidimicrobiia bacterium]|nr:HEAT repeat domain-containing protein [Acidimicrobiia bacterium]